MLREWFRGACLLFAIGWGANQYTALQTSYHEIEQLSAATTQGLFAVYAAALIPGLLVGGPLGDRYGRRRIVLPAGIISLLGSVILLLGSDSLALLLLGRIFAGAATGVVLATGTAWVKELSGEPAKGARRAGIAVSAGFGAGPFVSGAVAQWVSHPLQVAYVPHLIVMSVAMGLAWTVRETGVATPGRVNFGILRERFFWRLVVPGAPWVFTAPAVAFAVLPTQVAPALGKYATGFAGLAAGVTLTVGVSIQGLGRRLAARDPRYSAWVGMVAMVLGVACAALASALVSPWLALLAGVFLGAGYGLLLIYGLTEVARWAPPTELAGANAVFYSITYLGFSVPFLIALLAPVLSTPAALWCLAALGVGTLIALVTAREPAAVS